jgi:capsular polysaccharide biosynthesis protein
MELDIFEALYLDEINNLSGYAGRVSVTAFQKTEIVKVIDCKFGISSNDPRLSDQTLNSDRFDYVEYIAQTPLIYKLNDCLVLTGYGLIALGDKIARESTAHFPLYLFNDFVKHDSDYRFWSVRRTKLYDTLEFAISCHHGVNDNYYHWLVLFLPKLHSNILSAVASSGTGITPPILCPPLRQGFHRDSIDVFRVYFNLDFLILNEDSCVQVGTLFYPIPERGIGLTPHPLVRDVFHLLKKQLVKKNDTGPRKLFISRADTSNRKIVNEDDVAKALTSRGFDVMTLSNLSLSEQISLFSNAEVVIGQHGAGLTNIGFCSAGTKVLELHNPSYQNWCYRRIAALFGLRYGFIFGNEDCTEMESKNKDLSMTINIAELLDAVETMEAYS